MGQLDWINWQLTQLDWMSDQLLASLREADAMNHTVLSGMPWSKAITYNAVDFENGERLEGTGFSRTFKRGTNFPSKVICNIGAKVSCSSLTVCWQRKGFPTDLLVL